MKNKPNVPDPATLTGAAIYTRVSSTGQLGRDGDEDGYSIPAQIKAGQAEAERLGVPVVQAYIERAESARSGDRPVLQQMMAELPTLGVRYLIVHKVDRLARNRLDDATLYEQLVRMGITLVSVTENIDETPAGRLMHGMLASFAEYYSNNLASEITKGLLQKHALGGTPFKPPIGYMPMRELVNGQDRRWVVVDPERAPLIRLAFQLYATGQWSVLSLAAHLEDEGLRSRGTSKRPPKSLNGTTLHKVLTNPYYKGVVVYSGRRNPNGRHERLVDPDTWDQVQMILTAHRIAGDRPSKHFHYLRGKVVCSECRGRLLFGRHRSHTGRHYEYFGCINRATRGGRPISCSTGYYKVAEVEEQVVGLWGRLKLTDDQKDAVRRELTEYLDERAAAVAGEAERHRRTVAGIEANQEKLVQLYYRDLVSDDVLRREQDRLRTEKAAAEQLLAAVQAETVDLQERLEQALARIKQPHRAFVSSDESKRRVLNEAVFVRIEVGTDGELSDTVMTPVYEAIGAWSPGFGRPVRPGSRRNGCRASGPTVRPPAPGVHLMHRRSNPGSSPRSRGSLRLYRS